jgi:acetyl esterase/lipase
MKRFLVFAALLAGLFLAPLALTHAADDPAFSRKEVIYGRKFGTALTMDVFTPKKEANGAGVIVVISGGWYSDHNSITPVIPLYIQPLLDKGYSVFAVVHCSNPKYSIPEILEDLHRAVRFIRHNAKEYGIEGDRLGIIGGSAGGHLSLMQGCAGKDANSNPGDPLDRESSRVQAVVSFYPPTDFLNWGEKGKVMLGKGIRVPIQGAFDFHDFDLQTRSFHLITGKEKREEIGKKISPITHVRKDNPPTLIIHGDMDDLVPLQQSETMAARLKEAGAPSELFVMKGGKHDFVIVKEYMPKGIEWFDKYLAKKGPGASR